VKNIFYLKKNDTLKKAFMLLKGQLGATIFILDKKKILLGVVTDGDLRRSIARGSSLNLHVQEVMNKNAIYVFEDELKSKRFIKSKIDLGAMMDRPLIIPVLNKKKKFLYSINTEKFLEISQNKKIKERIISFKKPHILVVGGAGYIGSVLTRALLKKNWKVKVVDNFLYEKNSLTSFKKNKNLFIIRKDICDLNVQIDAVKDVDAVVFLAEIVGDPSCAAKPEDAIKTNYLAVSSLASLCSYMNINRFVYTSSCSVYGAKQGESKLLTENSALNPTSHYARIKIMSEKAVLSKSNLFFSPTILRLATVFGKSFRNRFDLVVNIFARNAHYHKKIKVNGGNQWRPNIHVEDVSSAIIRVLESPINKVENKIFNLCNDTQNYTINNISKIVKSVFPQCKIIKEYKNVDKRNYKVSSKKISDIINFKAKRTIKYSLGELKKFFKGKKVNYFFKKKFSNYETLVNEK
jgi:nucleoside-diphosphate-sugar epimerase